MSRIEIVYQQTRLPERPDLAQIERQLVEVRTGFYEQFQH